MGTINEPVNTPTAAELLESAAAEGGGIKSLNVAAFDELGQPRDPSVSALIQGICDLEDRVRWELRLYVDASPPEEPLPKCHRTNRKEMEEMVEFLCAARHELYEKLMPPASAGNLPRWTRELSELGAAMVVFEDAYANSGIRGVRSDREFRLPEELRLLLRVVMEKAEPPSWPDPTNADRR